MNLSVFSVATIATLQSQYSIFLNSNGPQEDEKLKELPSNPRRKRPEGEPGKTKTINEYFTKKTNGKGHNLSESGKY